ncbi:MAG TPA: hypothetical protein VLG37_01900 [Candidatus Saccharimonadales bacterium]|nr:hypothetical protein [Candidatus Saccharimonadales bacterium]
MYCDTTYGNLVHRIGQALESGRAVKFWEPARLVRGLLEYKIRHPGAVEDAPALIAQAMRTVVGIHAGALTLESFEPLATTINQNTSLIRSRVRQVNDRTTRKASNPAYCEAVSDRLREHLRSADALFIVLGHGGITAGSLTYIDYIGKKRASESTIYPVRFSTDKAKDVEPQVSPREVVYLQKLVAERSCVVVYDEDYASGKTLKRATAFFNELLDTETVPVANVGYTTTSPLVGAKALAAV